MSFAKLKADSRPHRSIEEVSAFLGKETHFEGKITFLGIFRLDGRFEGEIFDGGTLIVGESAFIRAKIGVNSIIISGHVEGEITAQERIEIHSTGKFYGDLVTPILVINEGGIFEGNCKMLKKERQNGLPIENHNPQQTFSF